MDFMWDVCGVSVWGVRGSPLGRPGPLMGRPWVVRGSILRCMCSVHESPMGCTLVAYGFFVGRPWGVRGSQSVGALEFPMGHLLIIRGAPMGRPWVTQGSLLGRP